MTGWVALIVAICNTLIIAFTEYEHHQRRKGHP